jgi:tryptophan-rich sensory protein
MVVPVLGLHRPDLAFFEIVALWLVILVVMVRFWREDRGAGALMLPYFATCGAAQADDTVAVARASSTR